MKLMIMAFTVGTGMYARVDPDGRKLLDKLLKSVPACFELASGKLILGSDRMYGDVVWMQRKHMGWEDTRMRITGNEHNCMLVAH